MINVKAANTPPTVPTNAPRVRPGLPAADELGAGPEPTGVADVTDGVDPIVPEPAVGVLGVGVGAAEVLPGGGAEAVIVTEGLLAEAEPEITVEVVAGEMTLYGMGTDRYVAMLETGRTAITAEQSLWDCAS